MRLTVRSSLVFGRIALAMTILAGCSTTQAPDQQAACVGPELDASPGRVSPGKSFELDGRNFFTGCEDVIIDGEPVDEQRPEQDVEIELRQGSRVWELATVDAGENYSISAKLTVPEEVRPGKAIVTASGAKTRVRVLGG